VLLRATSTEEEVQMRELPGYTEDQQKKPAIA
jgi:hypothetical protein